MTLLKIWGLYQNLEFYNLYNINMYEYILVLQYLKYSIL